MGVVVLGSNALTARREQITIFDRDDAHALHKATLIFDYLEYIDRPLSASMYAYFNRYKDPELSRP